MSFFAPRVRLSMRLLWVIAIAIFLSHAVIGFLLYRWRVISQSAFAHDWIVFGVPFWLAFAAYWAAFLVSPYLRRRSVYRYIGFTVLAFAGAACCWFFYMLLAANFYGT